MKKNPVLPWLLIFLFASSSFVTKAQGTNDYQSNAISFNLGQALVNEFNLGYEHYFSEKKSVEINGGLIYRNNFLRSQAEEWTNSQYFNEHGFAGRLMYKIYRKAGDKAGRKNYYSIGLNYQYLYFNNEWFDLGTVKDDTSVYFHTDNPGDSVRVTGLITRDLYQHRFRNRIGIQVLLGNIIPMGKTAAIEIYYGIGVRGILSNRFDVAVHDYFSGTSKAGVVYATNKEYVSNNDDQKFYIRPTIHAGVKLRFGW